jgi:hypothetical protein
MSKRTLRVLLSSFNPPGPSLKGNKAIKSLNQVSSEHLFEVFTPGALDDLQWLG